MFDWLFEGWLSVYLLLAAVALAMLVVWWTRRQRFFAIGLVVTLALIVTYALLDFLVETPRKQLVRTVLLMATGAKEHDTERVMQYISDRFTTHGGKQKVDLRSRADSHIKQVEDVQIISLEVQQLSADRLSGIVRFNMILEGTGLPEFARIPYHYKATFQKEGNRWRLVRLEIYQLPLRDPPMPLPF